MTTYYVSTSGNNSNPGTLSSPWLTINYSVEQLSAGDTLYIRGGTYQESVACIRSGTAASKINIVAYANETPIIDGNNYTIPSGDGVLFQISGDYVYASGLTVQYSHYMGVLISGTYCTVDNFISHHNMSNGILITGSHSTVQNSTVHDVCMDNVNGTGSGWGSALTAARHPSYATIKNNLVYHNWGEGISTYEAEYTTIQDNICYDSYSTNYYISDTIGSVLQRNIGYNTGAITEGANFGILVGDEKYNPASSGNTIINNLIYHCSVNLGIGTTESTNNLVANNTFVNADGSYNILMYAGTCSNAKFINNIIVQEDAIDIFINSGTGWSFSHNLWSKAISGSGLTDIVADPLLAKVGGTGAGQLSYTYFELLAGSPAIDTGESLPQVTIDYNSNSRGGLTSIGGLEYASTTTSGSSEIPPPPPTEEDEITPDDSGNDEIPTPPDEPVIPSDTYDPLAFSSKFDYFDLFERPTFILCNPNREKLYAMKDIYGIKAIYRYNAASEISFSVPKTVGGNNTEYYGLLEYPRVVYIEDRGYFVIVNCSRHGDGIQEYKEVQCYSLEYNLAFKNLSKFEGTYKFYDLVDPTGTLLQKIISYLPGWSIGDVDASLMGKYRTFDISDKNIYNFLMEDVEKTYQCIFTFDTVDRTISATVPSQASSVTDIFLSTENVLKSFNLEPINEELITALTVYGGGDLTINTVNPLGNDNIYNFEYFENTNWMSQSLIDALNAWEAKITSQQGAYADLLTTLKNYNDQLVTLEGQLVDLQAEYDALDVVRKVRIEQGLSIKNITNQINAKQAEIDAKEAEITAKEAQITATTASLRVINDDLDMDNNFTSSQLDDLSNYTRGQTYQNENFIQTDSMSNAQIQDMAQNLYDQAVEVLAKLSVPRYTFTVDSANFMFLKEYESFIDQLKLGCTMTVKPNENVTIYPALLEIELSYDNPEDFTLTFSNRMRLDTAEFIIGDLYGKTQDMISSTSFNLEMWNDWTNNHKDDVTNFIDSALNASLNNVVSSTNQEIKISEAGLKGKRYLPESSTYSPEQIWLTSNQIVFTDDNWQTARTALGKITFNGITTYGLVAETIVGNIIASNELIITNENNSFRIDGGGVWITDANVNVTTLNGNTNILIDPINGIKIRKKNGADWTDKFYADADGNLTLTGRLVAATGDFSGKITALEGSIGGITINSKGIQKDAGNYIRSNGDFKWGMLTMQDGSAYFNGNIYANNLLGLLQAYQIGSVNADTITTGTLNAIDIYGCNIYWPGAYLHSRFYGSPEIYGEESLKLSAGNTDFYKYGITLTEPSLSIRNPNMINIGGLTPTTQIRFIGSLFTRDVNNSEGYGVSETVTVNTGTGNRKLNFVNGLLITKASSGNIPSNDTFFTEFGFSVVVPVDSTGVAGHTEVPYDCEINSIRVTSETSCSTVVDISVRPFNSFSEVVDVSITSGSGFSLSGKTYESGTLSKKLYQGEYLIFSVETATGATETVNIAVKGKR